MLERERNNPYGIERKFWASLQGLQRAIRHAKGAALTSDPLEPYEPPDPNPYADDDYE